MVKESCNSSIINLFFYISLKNDSKTALIQDESETKQSRAIGILPKNHPLLQVEASRHMTKSAVCNFK